jgi:transcriptional regulator with XRE-family HTH domain
VFYEQIKKLCKENDITLTRLLLDFGMSKANATHWKNGITPSTEMLQKIATYFNVTIDYLLGNEQKKSPTETVKDEKIETIIELLSDYTPEQLEAFLTFLKGR